MLRADRELIALAVIAYPALIATLYLIVVMCRTPLDRDGRPVRKKRRPRDEVISQVLPWRPSTPHLRPAPRSR